MRDFLMVSDMGEPGQDELLTATRFAEVTGVSRERLRTWERRFGFPAPVRHAGGRRRYRAGDAARVVAVRRAVAAGVPVAAAIEASAAAAGRVAAGPAQLAAVAARAPVPVVLLAGPRPLRVAWANAAAGEVAAIPPAEAVEPLLRPDAPPVELEHPAWDGSGGAARSIAFALPGPADAAPLVALVGIAGAAEQRLREALGAVRAEHAELRRRADRHVRWLDALTDVAIAFQREPGPDLVDQALDVLIRSTGAVDAGVAIAGAGRLELEGSRRGLVRGGALTGAAHPDLVRALRDREGIWLRPAARSAFGVPRALEASFVPIVVGGEPLGALVTCFTEVEPHDSDNRRLLATLSATFGFAMLRDRLVRELEAATAERRP